ncbi:MAG: L,D-transpeptidase family protein [Bacteroidales bacterium]|nr:L,D-transpeptidase family protein [Bacteroidales bacterium]
MRKIYVKLLVLFAAVGLIALIVYLLIINIPTPPIKEINKARIALSKAFKNRADTYSNDLYGEARSSYDSAMANWQKENYKFIYFRNYDKVTNFAKLTIKKAERAIETSTLNLNSYKVKLKDKIETLNKLVEDINSYFNRYPLPAEVRNSISNGRFQLKEGEIDFEKGQFLLASKNLNNAEDLLSSAYDKAYSDLEQYLKSYPRWKKWAESAIKESKKNQNYSIIVDKLSRKCFVYYNGIKKYEFDVELGRNWIGDKKKMGDKATPEGMYKIINKFSGTKYNNALLINYPNDEDKQRFNLEKSKGIIPKTAKIGGGIEIHGSGGKGVDWTEGCIALEDSEMEVIYRIANVGTPVTIVGSIKNLQQILTR